MYIHCPTVAVPVVMADSTIATSISLSWTTSGSEGVSYTVVWQRDTSGDCSDENEGSESLSGGSMTMYDIPDLEEDSTYSITVTATNTLGSKMSVAISANTLTAGEYETLVLMILSVSLFLSAPTAAPESVTTPSVTSSTITVQWGMVPCIHHNGDITGYSVRYGVMGSGSSQTKTVSGASETETSISDLISSTTYDVQVAAVNVNGTGVYSNPTSQLTRGQCV